MRFLLTLVVTFTLALALGIGSAWYMVETPHTGADIGAWHVLPPSDLDTIDPYTRARIARTGEILMGAGEGLTFQAERDDLGRRIDGRCDYVISGDVPPARLWTLTVTDALGDVVETPSKRTHIQSREILRDTEGRFEIVVSAEARPGNWLPAPSSDGLKLTLRLYDTPFNLGSGTLPPLPHVVRRACR